MIRFPLFFVAVIMGALPGAAHAQTAVLPGSQPNIRSVAPYDQRLLRLAEVLGSLHYLRDLCGAGEGTVWRDRMNEIIKAEKPDAGRKGRMVTRFNHGYNSYRAIYRECTLSALAASSRYVEEGAQLANQITSRFGR